MGHEVNLQALYEMEEGEAANFFRSYMKGSIRAALVEIMQEEVSHLCGPRHHPDRSQGFQRAGSEDGIFYEAGKKQPVRRPRVRKDGQEIGLKTYGFAREIGNITEEVLRAVENGVSTRGYQRLQGMEGISKSEVSRIWAEKGAARLEELRSRDISQHRFFWLLLDGVNLSADLHAIVALGVTEEGEKVPLDFSLGATENFETVHDLMTRIVNRGFKPATQRLFCTLDGGAALKKAVRQFYPTALIQRCLVHKERNILGCLSYKYHAEFSRLMARLRKAQGEEAGREALNELGVYLSQKSASAYASLMEAGDELITLHLLDAPSTLNISLLSTNIIENMIKNLRRMIGRNNRWRAETSQAARWLAAGVLNAETGFRKIKGYQDIPKLMKSIDDLSVRSQPGQICYASLDQGVDRPANKMGAFSPESQQLVGSETP